MLHYWLDAYNLQHQKGFWFCVSHKRKSSFWPRQFSLSNKLVNCWCFNLSPPFPGIGASVADECFTDHSAFHRLGCYPNRAYFILRNHWLAIARLFSPGPEISSAIRAHRLNVHHNTDILSTRTLTIITPQPQYIPTLF